MRTPTNLQVINDAQGQPAFVVIPWQQYLAEHENKAPKEHYVPNEVIGLTLGGASPMRAWREHLNLTQGEVAARLGISQSGYQQMEESQNPRKATREKVARAFDIDANLLDF